MKSYFSLKEDNKVKGYTKKTSYLLDNSFDNTISDIYFRLPEEYDIFARIDPYLFVNRADKQHELIADCLVYMRKALISYLALNGITCVLPKLHTSEDSNGTISFNWAYSTFRAFLAFDDERGGYDAYSGMIYQTDVDSVSTVTRKITQNNYKTVIDELLNLLVNNA